MSLEYQKNVKELTDKYGAANIVVVLGFLDEELVEIYATTLILGDPSFSGSLAGVALRLKVYHILEQELKAQIPEVIYQEQMGLTEIATGQEKIKKISQMLKELRNKA